MASRDPRIDAYIRRAAPFARPVLSHLRRLVRAACPAARETLKWGMPYFLYNRQMLCGMASFKAHCSFGFWHTKMRDTLTTRKNADPAMGQFGRIKSLADLPSDAAIKRLVKTAMKLIDADAAAPQSKVKKPRPPLKVPRELRAAFGKSRKAASTFDGLSYSCKKEYVDWIAEAKRPETRQKRLATTIQWLSEGKSRNWKYER
jgi:uncharacterized protein YdeI (YjbR/CyaY-like superfamily)